MSKKYTFALSFLTLLSIFLLILLYLNTDKIAMLNPKGWVGLREKNLMIISIVLMLIVVIPVFIMTAFICWKYREDNTQAKYTPDWNHSVLAESIWWGFPCIIIFFLSIIGFQSSHELDPYKPLEHETKPLNIQVVALQWKWLFIYPEYNIATVNFLQIPEKTPINFEITADAPMNSFWIPQLGGQIYAMPGMRTKLHLIADEIGEFRGSSANLSGTGFAGMTFKTQATSQDDFEKWVQSVKKVSHSLSNEEYLNLVKPSEYNPEAFFSVIETSLFDQIVMKYMMPTQK